MSLHSGSQGCLCAISRWHGGGGRGGLWRIVRGGQPSLHFVYRQGSWGEGLRRCHIKIHKPQATLSSLSPTIHHPSIYRPVPRCQRPTTPNTITPQPMHPPPIHDYYQKNAVDKIQTGEKRGIPSTPRIILCQRRSQKKNHPPSSRLDIPQRFSAA